MNTQYTYVSEVYQWIIDDMIAKIRDYFRSNNIEDSLLHEIAIGWENRILEMKILEVPNQTKKNPSNNSLDISRARFTYGSNRDALDGELIYQLKQYRNIVYSLSNQRIKAFEIKNGSMDYNFCLCQKIAISLEKIELQIQDLINLDIISDLINPTTQTLGIIPNRLIEEKNTLESPISPRQAQNNLDREELSEFEDSESSTIEAAFEKNSHYVNRINCCYEVVRLRKIGLKSTWHCTLKNGIALIDGKEFVFHRALANLVVDNNVNRKNKRS
eukprot:gnl/TRDRNA2_/TRDRNA2_176722_c1_seq1.p1 gnl/TRDRNA2_/TRDRNA2_176722_c1~~gnl/TRDRNA2_/TRDRNA2_176722_c1_seq1.p1  ORF type:complete len:273 (-),score=-6.48 gnl/TRDRNA2_/TRDRNA2_176722_c1_seq1:98-916(-)